MKHLIFRPLRASMRLFAIVSGLALAAAPVRANEPVVDFAYLLSGTKVAQADRSFLPGFRDLYRAAFATGEITGILTRKGESQPIRTYTYTPRTLKGVISGLFLNEAGNFLKLDQMGGEGDYTLTFSSGGKPITVFDFSLSMAKTGDAFNPVTTAVLDGPWRDWALLRIPFGDGERDDSQARESLQLVNWAQNSGANQMRAEIRLDGDLIAEGDHYLQRDPFEWQRTEFKLRFPDNKGRAPFLITDLLDRDGTYDVFFTLGDELVSAFQLEVRDGREVYHPQQAPDYQPRTEYLLPRQYVAIGGGVPRGYDIVYMRALAADEAMQRWKAGPSATDVADDATRARWQWTPSADPARETQLTLTTVATEADATMRVGDEIVVFGTDYPSGLAWMKVGDTEPRSIPEGETFDSRVFGVCGRKIALTRKHSVAIFDTESGTLNEIPPKDIYLKDIKGGLHGNNYLACDGHLVATINDTRKVTDKLTIKVIDVSGDTPVVIPIKNGPYQDNRLDNIAVNAEEGMIAMGSSNEDAIYTAPVVSMANQAVATLKDYKSVRASQIFIADGGVVYADDEYKVRFLPFGSNEPRRITDQAFGRSSNGFFADHGRLVFVTSEKFGDRYEIAVGGLDEKPQVLDGTGTKIEGTSGALGMAGVGAIAPDGTVFLAGTPRGGVGTGEHLQILDKDAGAWLPVTDESGTAFGAIDVVAGERLVAFKYGNRSDTKIGYITFGESVATDDLFAAAKASAAAEAEAAEAAAEAEEAEKAAAAQAAQAEQAMQASQQDMALLAGYMQSEQEIAEAFAAAFGEEAGRKKAREMTLEVMRSNGLERLVPLYEKMMQ